MLHMIYYRQYMHYICSTAQPQGNKCLGAACKELVSKTQATYKQLASNFSAKCE